MRDVSMRAMRHLHRQINARFSDLLDWNRFSLEAAVVAVAARVQARIYLHPFPWEQNGYSGLTLGWRDPAGKVFLVLYEQEAADEHLLVIVLHELMHLLLGHCSANLTPQELRRVLRQLGLLPEATPVITYSRLCLPGDIPLTVYQDDDEVAAEVGAVWAMTRARWAGRLPPTGQAFTPEQAAISKLLGSLEAE